mmetsp:Transcript_8880/g.32731  ORF Transcript_8880/g.32731 Transcript_8880/m.32731 type:complete len:272 (+) Transcript_8880:331-1146(+)
MPVGAERSPTCVCGPSHCVLLLSSSCSTPEMPRRAMPVRTAGASASAAASRTGTSRRTALTNTVPAPRSFALSAASVMSSQSPSAYRYHTTAEGSATAQNTSSTSTYATVPAAPNSFTRSMLSDCWTALPTSAPSATSDAGAVPPGGGRVLGMRNTSRTEGVSRHEKAAAYEGSNGRSTSSSPYLSANPSSAESAATLTANMVSSKGSARAPLLAGAAPPAGEGGATAAAPCRWRRCPSRRMRHVAKAQVQLPTSVIAAWKGTSRLSAGAL